MAFETVIGHESGAQRLVPRSSRKQSVDGLIKGLRLWSANEYCRARELHVVLLFTTVMLRGHVAGTNGGVLLNQVSLL